VACMLGVPVVQGILRLRQDIREANAAVSLRMTIRFAFYQFAGAAEAAPFQNQSLIAR
jgi:hypothetical protein